MKTLSISQTIGQRIRASRNSANISQEELAELAGLHRTYIGSVERGERNITVLNLIRIARALQVDAGLFITNISKK